MLAYFCKWYNTLVCLLFICAACSPIEMGNQNPGNLTSPLPVPMLAPESVINLDLSPELHVHQIDHGAYVITHDFPWPANSLLVEMENGDLVWVGSTYTPQAAEIVLVWIRDTFGERQIIGINTGYHVDNLGGNAALIAAHIPVYGSDLTVKLLAERGETTRQMLIKMLQRPADKEIASAHEKILYLPPTEVFDLQEGLTLQFAEEQIEIVYPGPSQAPDKVFVYFPQRRILFGGCMILSADRAGNTAEADVTSWIEAVEKLQQYPAEIVVPGHGDRLDAALIEHTMNVLEHTDNPE